MKTKNECGIYMIMNIISKKVYIGSSCLIRKRWLQHRRQLRKNLHCNQHLQGAWNKHSENSFVFKIIEECNKEELMIKESFWINHYDSLNNEFGYNIMNPIESKDRHKKTNHSSKPSKEIVVIDKITGLVINTTVRDVINETGLLDYKISKLTSYWTHILNKDWKKIKNSRKSGLDLIIVNKDIYNPEFDYVNFNIFDLKLGKEKKQIDRKEYFKEYSKKYYKENKHKSYKYVKKGRNHNNCNLKIKRVKIMCVEVNTGKELIFNSILECIKDRNLLDTKVYEVLRYPFQQKSHRGYWFKRL